jgi:hypothetical protein
VRICYDIGFCFHPGSSQDDNAEVLRLLLENLIAINRVWLRGHPRTPPLYKAGVVYDRTMVWDSIPDLYVRKRGDCKSLTAALAAQLREAGVAAAPEFRFLTNPETGRMEYHILLSREVRRGLLGGKKVQREDPSRVLGMNEWYRSRGLWLFPE